ncbi:hypothetical protein B566_EDAN008181 [Ephemera danica]|nr:hypothetical protein B566_EDAN008181 [Ephemera danica]
MPLQTSASMPGSTGGILAEKLEQLDKAAQDWKKRIGPNDAIEFSVAGRMGISTPPISPSPVHLAADRKKKTPKPARFRSRIAGKTANRSAPGSPQKGDSPQHPLLRSISAPDGRGAATVEVPSPHDESFAKFFAPSTLVTSAEVTADVDIADFEELTQHTLLVQHKRTVKMQRRRLGSRNPVKALAARTDLLQEYQEVRTGAAEREMKRLNVEKLAKNSNLAVEALAGLASKEDFTAVALKKATSGPTSQLLPYQDLMLLQVKGRRHVQTRLVQPVAASVNLGDSYVLVTPSARTRSAEVAQQISQRKELGCSKAGGNVHTIDEGKIAAGSSVHRRAFWRILGVEDGNGEDTNMIYTVEEDELVPVERYWGCIPRIEMLDPAKVIVFDFGAELYIWSGKNASPEARKSGVNLARELWESGVDYSECDLSPVGEVSGARPSWALLGKLSHPDEDENFEASVTDTNMIYTVEEDELVPVERYWGCIPRIEMLDPAKVIVFDFGAELYIWSGKNASPEARKSGVNLARELWESGVDYSECDLSPVGEVDASIEVLPLDVKEMLASEWTEPDLELEGSHLGRGDSYFDPETHRVFEVTTSAITVWHVEEFGCHQVPPESLGRELSGAPSKHAMTGRSRCAYFFWQGSGASVSDQGAAALLTVELDREQGPHVRVEQGAEPSAFLRLFDGHMVTHAGHREEDHPERWRLYLVRSGGSHSAETSLVQVPCSTRQLRSRTSLLLLDIQSGHLWAWHGAQSHPTCRTAALEAASWLRDHTPLEFGLSEEIELKVTEDGHKAGEVLDLDTELARLTRSTYPPAQLLQRPLPDGVDPTRLEDYLAPTHFQELLGMTKEEYLELPSWKQTNVKKYAGLF